MNDGFKKFYNKANNKKEYDKDVVEKILQIAAELHSQNENAPPQMLSRSACEIYMRNVIDDLTNRIQTFLPYIDEELNEKYPLKINTEKEESKNESN